ncbi:MAG: carboxypeptidase-like regulatory domain-containing protein [Leptolyngbyaceae cyanobacterium MAG.088]|nr:carboxypeptidase-like regulatory domain-containing protein [Leptolyngbyaceae cyanobacterium MAG.088]
MVALTEDDSSKSKYFQGLSPVLHGIGLVLLCSQPGWSHGAIATVTRTFSVEASYASGQPMALAQVAVYSPENSNEPWLTGQTDQQGKFEFQPDTPGSWDVVIRQAGHGTTVNVPVETQAIAPIETSAETAQTAAKLTTTATAAVVSSSNPADPIQRWASAGAALWGLIGTVLFFSRGKKS